MVLHILSLFTIVIILQVSVLLAHELKFGRCPKVDVMEDFVYNKMLGLWHVIQMTNAASTCMTLDFKDKDGKFSVVERCKPMGVSIPFLMERFKQVGKLKIPNQSNPAKMTLSYPVSLIPYTEVDFWVMETDYTTYAATFSCRNMGFMSRQSAMILSRKLVLDQDIVDRLRNKFQSYSINKRYLRIVNQKGCAIEKKKSPAGTATHPVTTTKKHTVTAFPETETMTVTETHTTTAIETVLYTTAVETEVHTTTALETETHSATKTVTVTSETHLVTPRTR